MSLPRKIPEHVYKLCETNLKYLCLEILGMRQWGALHSDIMEFMRCSGNRRLILVPRGHLKSSVVTIGYTIQSILRNPDERILIANAVWDNARKFMWKIQEYLSDKSVLPQFYGNFQSKRWNQDEFVVSFRRVAHAEPTVSTTGVEKTQTSQHYDTVIMDDLVVRENIGTREQIQKVINFYKDTLDLLEPSGKMVIVGTRWAMSDLYQHIIETESSSVNGHFFKTADERRDWRKYAGRPFTKDKDARRYIDGFDVYIRQVIEGGKVIFPEKFCIGPDPENRRTDINLLKQSQGSFHFSSQYMNDPLDEETVEFKREYYQEYERCPVEGTDMMFVDPAFTAKQTNDASGIIVARFTKENIVYVMEAIALRRDPSGLVQELFRLWERYPGIIKTKVESTIAQVVITTLLKNEMVKRNKFYQIEEYRPPTYENKVARIRGLIPRYESGGFRFRRGLLELRDQMLEFPRSRRDDLIDSLSQGLSEWGTPGEVVKKEDDYMTYNWLHKRIHKPALTQIGGGFYDITGRR